MVELEFRRLVATDAEAAHRIEAASYPADEGASLLQIQSRLTQASDYFLGVFNNSELIGFVNGTLATHRELEEETMSSHDPNGKYLCIHSVAVDNSFRRQGIATRLLQKYVEIILNDHPSILALLLLAKPYLVQFYVGCGFTVTRLSPVVHGKDAWLELVLDCIVARRLPLVQVDAFTSTPYQGNPAAVVRVSAKQFEASNASNWMQNIAKENNLSETAFVAPTSDPSTFRLRWFTPAVEVNLCGHATLATAYTLFTDSIVPKNSELKFETKSGILRTKYHANDTIEMDFPAQVIRELEKREEILQTLVTALELSTKDVVDVKAVGADVIIHVTPEAFESLAPVNFSLLKTVECRGIILTCAGDGQPYDILSRFFGPKCGVDEDPVTGSAHCGLAPYWSSILMKTKLSARQASHRPGDIDLEYLPTTGRVILKGPAVITLRGVLI